MVTKSTLTVNWRISHRWPQNIKMLRYSRFPTRLNSPREKYKEKKHRASRDWVLLQHENYDVQCVTLAAMPARKLKQDWDLVLQLVYPTLFSLYPPLSPISIFHYKPHSFLQFKDIDCVLCVRHIKPFEGQIAWVSGAAGRVMSF